MSMTSTDGVTRFRYVVRVPVSMASVVVLSDGEYGWRHYGVRRRLVVCHRALPRLGLALLVFLVFVY